MYGLTPRDYVDEIIQSIEHQRVRRHPHYDTARADEMPVEHVESMLHWERIVDSEDELRFRSLSLEHAAWAELLREIARANGGL